MSHPLTRLAVVIPALVLAVALGPAPALTQPRTFDLQTSSVQDIQDAVAAGVLTYERLVQLYLARVAAYAKQGPRLNTVLHVNPRAFVGSLPPRDATIIAKLRNAGAIIFLKTNLDEFALGSQGLSSLSGQTLNVFDPRRSPGGSSGGTAVAVAAGFATLGVGTETGPSTRGPASNAGLVGFVFTCGLISRAGVIPLSFTQDRVGIRARSVADVAVLLNALKGFYVEDLRTSASLDVDDGTPAPDRGRARRAAPGWTSRGDRVPRPALRRRHGARTIRHLRASAGATPAAANHAAPAPGRSSDMRRGSQPVGRHLGVISSR